MRRKKKFRQKQFRIKNHSILGDCRIEEHRLVAVNKYKRKIEKFEVVHHEDRNRKNNDPSNIFIMTKIDHDKLHNIDRIIGTKKHLTGTKISEETKKKISDKAIGNQRTLGLKHKIETIMKMQENAASKKRNEFGHFLPMKDQ